MHFKSLFCALASACALSANAVTIVGTSGYSGSISFQANQYVAQPFAITGSATLDSVVFNFSKVATFEGLLQLTDGVGGSPSVLYSAPFTLADGPCGSLLEPFGAVGSALFSVSQNASSPEQSAFADSGSALLFNLSGEFSGVHDEALARQLLGSQPTSGDVPDSANTLPLCAGAMLMLVACRRLI